MKRSQLQKIIHEEVKAALSEAASPEAARLHAMTGCGQDAAQDFIDENGLDGRKLADYVQQNMRTNSTLKYDVRDYISGGKGTVGGEKNLRDKFINQFKMQIKEQSNPELDRTVGQFVSALAKKYSYSNADAVMAVFEALKRLNMIHSDVNYKAPSGVSIAEGAMSELDILMDESRNFEDFLSKIKSNPKFKDLDPSSPEVKEFLQTLWDDTMGKGSTMGMAAEGKVSKSVIQKLVRESIDRKLRKNK